MSRTKTSAGRTTSSASSVRPFTLGDRVYFRFGKVGTTAIYRFVSTALLALVLLVDYLLVMFTAVNVVPNIAAMIQRGTGVTVDLRIDTVIAGWLLPVLFIVAALLVGEVAVMRRLWRFAAGVNQRMRTALFRATDEDLVRFGAARISARNNAVKSKTAAAA